MKRMILLDNMTILFYSFLIGLGCFVLSTGYPAQPGRTGEMDGAMKLSFSTLGCPQYSLTEAIGAAQEYGFEGIEIRTVRGQTDLTKVDDFNSSNLTEAIKRLKSAGIRIPCLSSSIRFTSNEASERRRQHEMTSWFAGVSNRLECPLLRIFAGPIAQDEAYQEVYARMVEEIRVAAETCRAAGVSLVIETHDTSSTSDFVTRLLSDIDSTNVFILWDILHTFRHGERFPDTWLRIGELVKHVHIKDSAHFSRESFDLTLVGEGALPIPEVVAVLRDARYDGFLCFEWEKGWHPELPGPEIAFPHYVRTMRSLLERMAV
jgi:sugar phosphate isomerase/epimerase